MASEKKEIVDQLRRDTIRALKTRMQISPASPELRPINFNAEMTRAILAGKKTETRRLIKSDTCPLGGPGDFIYIREPFIKLKSGYRYAADLEKSSRKFTPAMYMPRDAARIILQIQSIETQHLQDLTPATARAEGCPLPPKQAIQWFRNLWNNIYPSPGQCWEDNPQVWRIRFSLAQAPKSC